MKNLNEEIDRIKKLMLLNEQCGGDLTQCEEDLEDEGYKVTSPTEIEDACDEVENIKNIAQIFSKRVNPSNPVDISNVVINSAGSEVDDCYILLKSKREVGGVPEFYITFYNDEQVVITKRLNSNMNNKKVIYSGKYSTNGTNLNIGKLKYKGIVEGNSTKMENGDYLNSSGNFINVDSTNAALLNIDEGHLTMKDILTWNLHELGYNVNVLKSSFNGKNACTMLLS